MRIIFHQRNSSPVVLLVHPSPYYTDITLSYQLVAFFPLPVRQEYHLYLGSTKSLWWKPLSNSETILNWVTQAFKTAINKYTTCFPHSTNVAFSPSTFCGHEQPELTAKSVHCYIQRFGGKRSPKLAPTEPSWSKVSLRMLKYTERQNKPRHKVTSPACKAWI